MIPGPDRIIACPHCGAWQRHWTLISGNTLGMEEWTDGKQVCPMLPHPPVVVVCVHCRQCYRLFEARTVPKIMRWLRPRKYQDCPQVVRPSAEDYHQLLSSAFARNPEEEKDLRLLAWRRENDLVRDGTASPRASNLRALLDFLDEGDEWECLLKAEVLRETGQFSLAVELLDRHPDLDFAEGAAELRRLCLAGDSQVKRFPLSIRKSEVETLNRRHEEKERSKRKLEARIEAARQKAISIGLATRENVDRVLSEMGVEEFRKHFSEFRVSRAFFGNSKAPPRRPTPQPPDSSRIP